MNARALAFLLAASPPAARAQPEPTSAPSSQPSTIPSSQPSSIPSSQPSSIPSSLPSSIPSTIPSSQPSSIPSTMPSSIPSTIPSLQPSVIPSTMPSLQPSVIPSTMPSVIPSSIPSRMPSSIPSRMPSTIPSKIPSRMPSSIPSQMPSSIPSKIPSRMPSSIPSAMPSSIPSESPSGQPSSIPSSQPSCTPSQSPSDPATSFLFYPDWSGGGTGCKNDGNEPSHMAANPAQYLSSTLDKCCSTYFSWNLNTCLGRERGICARALFYPDWENKFGNTGCIDDGNEPKYMTDNPLNYLFQSLSDCCDQHYSWDKSTCMGTAGTLNSNMWYADFAGTVGTCKTGGGQPKYMNNSPTIWLHSTLEACCSQHYSWDKATCLGSSSGSSSSSSSTSSTALVLGWYPDWHTEGAGSVCKNDGLQPNYMTQNPTNWITSTLDACCKKNYNWETSACIANSGGISATSGTYAGSGNWYKRSEDWICVQDCTGADPCGGIAASWEPTTYTTRNACCASMPYDTDCKTRAITGGTSS